jgi:hypothetical protein
MARRMNTGAKGREGRETGTLLVQGEVLSGRRGEGGRADYERLSLMDVGERWVNYQRSSTSPAC